jgi:glycine/D-amino acid oxidase-like deaminating enzyme
LQQIRNIDYRPIKYVSFAHDDTMHQALEASMAWSDAALVEPKDFRKLITPFINPAMTTYQAALITNDCWQATPGRVIDLIRQIGIRHGGTIEEDCKIIHVTKEGEKYHVLVQTHSREYVEYITPHFVNALGPESDVFAKQLGIETGLYPVKHQAFITRDCRGWGLKALRCRC